MLLGNEDLLGRDLYPHVPSGHHAALALLDDLGQVLDSLLILNLGNDENFSALLAKYFLDLFDPISVPDEGCEDHVDSLLHSEQQVRFVLLRHGGEVGVGPWKVAALPRAEVAIILDDSDEVILSNFLADNRDESVVNEESLAGSDDLADVLVVHPEHVSGALLLVLLISGDLDGGAFLQSDLLPAVILKIKILDIMYSYFKTL